ncbi:MAG: cation:proton antiporter [Candidatus Bathyarchaeales archaeon]
MAEPFVMMEQVIIVLLAGIIGAKLSERFGLPIIIPLFISGYLIGPEGLGIFAPLELGLSLSVIVTLAIPIILFDEGMRIDIKLLNEFKLTVFLLATLAVIISAVGVGLVAEWIFGMPPFVAFLTGSILAATSPGATVAIVKQLKVERRISTIMEAESSLNDATSIVLFVIFSGAILSGELSFSGAVFSFLRLFFGGLVVGALIALIAGFFIERLNVQEYAIYLSLVIFLAAYSVAELLTASAATAVVASGLVLGGILKRPTFGALRQEKVLEFWSNIAFLAQSIIFLVLGAGFSTSMLTSVWFQATAITLLLFFVIRPISVFAASHFEKKLTRKEKLFLSWTGARGAVPAALAASAIGLGIVEGPQIFNVVLVVVLESLLIIGFTGRKMARATLATPSTSKK